MSETLHTVTAPNRAFEGTRCGVKFTKGRARASELQAVRLAARGYLCPAAEAKIASATEASRRPAEEPEPTEPEPTEPEEGTSPEADDLTVIDGIGTERVRVLIDNGIATFAALAECDPVVVAAYFETPLLTVAIVETWKAQASARIATT